MNKLGDSLDPEPDNDIVIPRDPTLFNHQRIYDALLAKIQEYNKGKNLKPMDTCRCSYYPLADLVKLACEGDFFRGHDSRMPEELAAKLTDYLWREVVRIYQKTQ